MISPIRPIGLICPIDFDGIYGTHGTNGTYVERLAVGITNYFLLAVSPGQSSVRNGVTGKPSLLKRLQTGLSAQA